MANISTTEFSLECHSSINTRHVAHIDGEITINAAGTCRIGYRVSGALDQIHFAAPATASRLDGLWQSTCFELFLKRPEGSDYLEFNFAPSHEWAAYQFDDYRAGMAELEVAPPHIKTMQDDDAFQLVVEVELPTKWRAGPIVVGVSAVIAEKNGQKSYWALAHPAGQPDFHHKDCFALQLDARSAP